MKTSLDIPDELYRQVKSKSALEGRAVREVATALFTAWVEGRVTATGDGLMAADSGSGVPDQGELWLTRWRELGASVAQNAAGGDSLVELLHRDRR